MPSGVPVRAHEFPGGFRTLVHSGPRRYRTASAGLGHVFVAPSMVWGRPGNRLARFTWEAPHALVAKRRTSAVARLMHRATREPRQDGSRRTTGRGRPAGPFAPRTGTPRRSSTESPSSRSCDARRTAGPREARTGPRGQTSRGRGPLSSAGCGARIVAFGTQEDWLPKVPAAHKGRCAQKSEILLATAVMLRARELEQARSHAGLAVKVGHDEGVLARG